MNKKPEGVERKILMEVTHQGEDILGVERMGEGKTLRLRDLVCNRVTFALALGAAIGAGAAVMKLPGGAFMIEGDEMTEGDKMLDLQVQARKDIFEKLSRAMQVQDQKDIQRLHAEVAAVCKDMGMIYPGEGMVCDFPPDRAVADATPETSAGLSLETLQNMIKGMRDFFGREAKAREK